MRCVITASSDLSLGHQPSCRVSSTAGPPRCCPANFLLSLGRLLALDRRPRSLRLMLPTARRSSPSPDHPPPRRQCHSRRQCQVVRLRARYSRRRSESRPRPSIPSMPLNHRLTTPCSEIMIWGRPGASNTPKPG